MNLTPDDPRLSAYLLGELTDSEAAEVERAVAADPALRMSFDELREMTAFMERALARDRGDKLLPSQRQAVIRAGRNVDAADKVVEIKAKRRPGRPWMAALGAAAAVVVAALVAGRMDVGGDGGPSTTLRTELAMMPLPGPGHGSIVPAGSGGSALATEQLERLEADPETYLENLGERRESLPTAAPDDVPATGSLADFSDEPELRLPVVLGTSSLAWISHAIRELERLPKRDLVRVEELVNACALPGERERLWAGSIACPWHEDSLLVAVQLTAGDEALHDAELRSIATAPRRLLGSFAVCGDDYLPTTVPAGRRTLVMLEAKNVGEPGDIELTASGVTERVTVEPVGGAAAPPLRHAALMAGFGLWLRGEGVEAEDLENILAAETDRDPIRETQRRLVRRALELAR